MRPPSKHRSGTVSHFLCGVATPPDNPRDKPTVFQSFCKVGTGYTMLELRTLNQQLMSHWRPYDPRRPPPSLAMATGGGSEKPSVWIEPCKSKIIQIRAAEIVSSDRYKTGCTLRFPRLEKFRDDKEWYQCMSTEELEQLRQMASGHLAHQHYDGEVDGEAPSSKRRKKAGAFRVEMPRGVAAQFRHTDTSDVQETGSMFKGKEFCVNNGSRDWGKDRMERVIAEHGGGFVQHPGAATTYVVVASMVQRAKNILQGGKHDIVKIEWFEQCLLAGRCIPLVPFYMVHTSPPTAEYFAQLYDHHGDSYTEPLNEESLATVFETISQKGTPHPVTALEIQMIESRYFPQTSPLGLFRQYRFYVDRFTDIGNPKSAIPNSSLELTTLDIRYHGGTLATELDEAATHVHVVIDENDLSRLSALRALERSHRKKHYFVTSAWVEDSIDDHAPRNKKAYQPSP